MPRWILQPVLALALLLLPLIATAQQSNGSLSPTFIGYPTYVMHGAELTLPVTVTNSGDAPLTGTIAVLENATVPGNFTGWLAVDQTSLNIPAGDQAVFDVTLNPGGSIFAPGIAIVGTGWVVITVDSPAAHDSLGLPVEMIVADTVVAPIWDTVATSCIPLTVGTNGNLGHQGVGGANMNFFADCDDSDTIPGDASIYLYEASPVIFRDGVAGSWSMYTQKHRLLPITHYCDPGTFSDPGYTAFWSSKMVTQDSALTLEVTVYAPGHPDSCNFLVHRMRLTSTDGGPVNNLTIGMLLDWNIPSDTLNWNTFDQDVVSNTAWQQGLEIDEPVGDLLECQQNDARFGGVGLIGYTDAAHPNITLEPPFSLKAAEVDSLMGSDGDLDPALVYTRLSSGTSPGVNGPGDLMTLLTTFNGYDLAAGDQLDIFTALAVIENGSSTDLVQSITKARNWLAQRPSIPNQGAGCMPPPCCTLEGDVTGDNRVNLTDLTWIVNCMFLTFECNFCFEASDLNNDCTANLTDLTIFVQKLFVNPSPFAPCVPSDNCP